MKVCSTRSDPGLRSWFSGVAQQKLTWRIYPMHGEEGGVSATYKDVSMRSFFVPRSELDREHHVPHPTGRCPRSKTMISPHAALNRSIEAG
jgi:hypothetical protein